MSRLFTLLTAAAVISGANASLDGHAARAMPTPPPGHVRHAKRQEATSTSLLNWPATPLNQLSFPKPTDAPYQVYPPTGPQFERGPQTGYNICNSTTEGQTSMCQTSYFNGPDDFCLWAPDKSNSLIANTEGEVVSFCSKKGHGTRQIPDGAIKGMQVLKHEEYWMITGMIDQPKLNIQDGDFGGELDSGGQDGRGNPIGGLVYGTVFNSEGGPNQIQWWTEFIGSNHFCIKVCNPTSKNQAGYCQHTLDRIGLAYNCPSKYTIGAGYKDGEFEVCDTAPMDIPGVYVENGVTMSYAQPPESEGPITTVPYTPTAPASSNCVTSASSALFSGQPTVTAGASSSASVTQSGSGSASATGSASKSGSHSSAAGSASRSGSAAAASATQSGDANAAGRTMISTGALAVVAVVAAALF